MDPRLEKELSAQRALTKGARARFIENWERKHLGATSVPSADEPSEAPAPLPEAETEPPPEPAE